MKLHDTEIKFKTGDSYGMDTEEHTLTLTLWQWDQLIDALRLAIDREVAEYRRYRELQKLRDWRSKKRIIDALRDLEHQINCELQYQIDGTRCDVCKAHTASLVDAVEAYLTQEDK